MQFDSNRAIYLQIGDYICEQILRKQWQSGSKIPSVREMAVQIEVNPNTVMRTYTRLQKLGIIYNQRGIGFFVAPQGYQKTILLKKREFMQTEVPRFHKLMHLLGIDFNQLHEIFAQLEEEAHENQQ
jgi:DNA-binding transcriptional regulator YhcF (GntR family)